MSKSKRQKFSKVAAVKSNARDRIGMPKPSEVITPKTNKKPRYKTNWTDFLDEQDAMNQPSSIDLGEGND